MGDCGLSEQSIDGGDVTFCDLMGAIYVSCGKQEKREISVLGLGVNPSG